MSEMVERVARAMLSAMDKELPGRSVPYDDQTPIGQQQRDTLNRVAVACINAMREPTEYMLMSMYSAPEVYQIGDNVKEVARYKYEKKYQAAIDAAINEGK